MNKEPRLNVRISEDLDVRFEVEVAKRRTTKQDATTEALESWLSAAQSSPGGVQNRTELQSGLTEDHRDLIDMLATDPKKALVFAALQTTVKHALEEYRAKWKPKSETKATSPRAQHQRRPTGT